LALVALALVVFGAYDSNTTFLIGFHQKFEISILKKSFLFLFFNVYYKNNLLRRL